ncbi:Acidic fibroblast growth factor intracellular-binding protein, partial [Stegodyphus mimosarum]
MMCNWSCPKPDCSYEETAMEIDREFLQDLRELKQILEKDTFDELKAYVLSSLRSKLPDRTYSDLDANFKFIEPLRQGRWSEKDLQKFLEVYTSSASHMQLFRSDSHLLEVWERYMSTMSSFILKMFHQ